jgi:quercetin dioxygenase-like cupin family protein
MKSLAAIATSFFLLASVASAVPDNGITVRRAGSQPSTQGAAEYFTGSVRIGPRFSTELPARLSGAMVHFEPGARTAWHTHPLGQTLYITSGCGWVQSEGGPVREVRPRDIVQIPANARH